jgi:hypothetical protein
MRDEIPSRNMRSHMTIRLVGESRVLNALLFSFFVTSWIAKKLGPQIPRAHESIRTMDLSMLMKSWENLQVRKLSEPLDLG